MEDEHYTDEYVEKLERELATCKELLKETLPFLNDGLYDEVRQACTLANDDSKGEE